MIPVWLANVLCYIVGPMLVVAIVALVLTQMMEMP